MGFFSWKCCVSNLSIASNHTNLPEQYSDCYLVTPNKTYHEPSYEGYGKFDGVDIYELLGREKAKNGVLSHIPEGFENPTSDYYRSFGIDIYYGKTAPFEIKIILASEYTGQSYDELEESERCPYQGYFYDDEYLVSIGVCSEEEEDEEETCEYCGSSIYNCCCDGNEE